jgi:hypothetical protein
MPKVVEIAIGVALIGIAALSGVGLVSLPGLLAGHALGLFLAGATMFMGGITALLQPNPLSGMNPITIRQAVAPRVILYGQAPLGGFLSYIASAGSSNEYLHLVFTFSGCQLTAIDEVWFDNNLLQFRLQGGSVAPAALLETGYYNGLVLVEEKLGAPGEAAFPQLIADTAGLGAWAWSSTDRQDGCCSMHFRLKWDNNHFPNGVPQIKIIARGRPLYDPRTSESAYTPNLALVIRDYLTDRYFGVRAPAAVVNDTLMMAAANLADELVDVLQPPVYASGTAYGAGARVVDANGNVQSATVPGVSGPSSSGLTYTPDGGSAIYGAWNPTTGGLTTDQNPGEQIIWENIGPLATNEARYQCNGAFTLDHSPQDILQALLAAGNGRLSWIAGLWNVYLGAWREPELSIDQDGLRDTVVIERHASRRDAVNAVKGTFLDPGNQWQKNSFPPVIRAAYVADDSGFPDANDRGFWALGSIYAVNDAVIDGGDIGLAAGSSGGAYICTQAHTSSATNRPNGGSSSSSYWTPCLEIAWKDVDYALTTSPSMAQRLASMELEQARRPNRLTLPAKFGAYQAQPPDTFTFAFPFLGFTDQAWEIQQLKVALAEDLAIGVDLISIETDSGIYAWSTAQEQLMGASLRTPALVNPTAVAPVTSLSLESGPATMITNSDGINSPRILVMWNPPADQFVLAGGKIFIDYQVHASGNWISGNEVDGAVTQCYLQGVTSGVSYDVRVRCRNVAGCFSAYAEQDSLTASCTVSSFVGSLGAGLQSNGQNLADNPSFEIAATPSSGDLVAAWYAQGVSSATMASGDGPSGLTVTPVSGVNVVSMSFYAGTIPENNSWLGIIAARKSVSVAPGQLYQLSGQIQVKWNSTLPSGVRAYAYLIAIVTYTDASIDFFSPGAVFQGTFGWQPVLLAFNIPASNGSGSLPVSMTWGLRAVVLNLNSSPATVGQWPLIAYFDNFSIRQATEQSQLPPVTQASFNSAIVGGGSPLTAIDAGTSATIEVAAFALQTGWGIVYYNAGSIAGLAYNTGYYVYTDDPTMAGGSVTYLAATTPDEVVVAQGYVLVGVIITPKAASAPTSGSGGGGHSPGWEPGGGGGGGGGGG